MAIEKIVKTRKKHTCCICNKTIMQKSEAYYWEYKAPKYKNIFDSDGYFFYEVQIGIEYHKDYAHEQCVDDSRNDVLSN